VARRTGRPSQAPKPMVACRNRQENGLVRTEPRAGADQRRPSRAEARSWSPGPGGRDRRGARRGHRPCRLPTRSRARTTLEPRPLRVGLADPVRPIHRTELRDIPGARATGPKAPCVRRRQCKRHRGGAEGVRLARRVPRPRSILRWARGFVSLFAPADAPAPIRGKPVRHRPTPSPSRPRLDPRARPDCPARASLPAPEAFGRGEADLPSRAAAPTSLGAEAGAGAMLRACPSTGTRMLFTIL